MSVPTQSKKYVRFVSPIVRTNELYTSKILEEDIFLLQSIYPFVNINVIGRSVLGKPIYELKIGTGKQKIHLNGSFHANEWLTSAILMKFVNEYLLAPKYYCQFTLSVVPMVNPDGVDLVIHEQNQWWKANINGVDLNNQFPAKWEVEKERKTAKAPAPRDYPGHFPLSEPEAKAMAKLALKENFHMLLAFHSQGREIYWGYEGCEPKISKQLVQAMKRASGYQAVQYIDSHAGFRDWFIQTFRKAGFTIEVGKGINPLPLSSFPENYRDVKNIIMACFKKYAGFS